MKINDYLAMYGVIEIVNCSKNVDETKMVYKWWPFENATVTSVFKNDGFWLVSFWWKPLIYECTLYKFVQKVQNSVTLNERIADLFSQSYNKYQKSRLNNFIF